MRGALVSLVALAACAPAPATPPPRAEAGAAVRRTVAAPPPAQRSAPAERRQVVAAAVDPATDFVAEVRRLHRLAACAGDAALPVGAPAELVESHCRYQRSVYERHRKRVLAVARPFLASLRPAGLPRAVVYPFGGGDLLYALTAFPDAEEITTISLERAGDIRGVDGHEPEALRRGLRDVAWMTMRLAIVEYSFTTHMGAMQRSRLPVQLVLALAALAIHDLEPVSLRYFRIAPDGSLSYLSRAELAAAPPIPAAPPPRKLKAKRKRRGKRAPALLLPEVFANVELGFRPRGASGPIRIYRHVAANLDDEHLKGSPLLRHLERKGRIAAMTKAASYLLWLDSFSRIREYLLAHMEWMVSDSTGILPRHAEAAGFEQVTYGRFKRSLLGTAQDANIEMGKLWRSQPRRPLAFYFGYPDFDNRSAHLLVTRRRTR